MKLDLTRIFIRNKMRYPVRILVSLGKDGGGSYKRIPGKSEIGPLSITKDVLARIASDPNVEVFNF